MEIKLNFFKDRRLVLLTLLNLVIVGVLLVVVNLVLTRDAGIRLDYERLVQFSNHQENWRRIVATWSATAARRAVIDDYFITSASLPIFIEQLESLADTAAVQLQLTDVAVTTQPESLLDLNFTVTGSLSRVRHFWALIDRLPALTTVTSFELSERSVSGGASLWVLTANLQLANFQHD